MMAVADRRSDRQLGEEGTGVTANQSKSSKFDNPVIDAERKHSVKTANRLLDMG